MLPIVQLDKKDKEQQHSSIAEIRNQIFGKAQAHSSYSVLIN